MSNFQVDTTITDTPQIDHVRPIDQTVLELLGRCHPRGGDPHDSGSDHWDAAVGMTVPELTESLQVTPTAVRQRLERLISLGLVERHKESVGRGRPQFRYRLTLMGMRYASASYADLAAALWQELLELPNPRQRVRVLQRVAKRMGRGLKEAVPSEGTVGERMTAAAHALGRRKIAAAVNVEGQLPVLEVHACPYPDLAENDEHRQLCELEQEMLSEAIGQSMQLDCCRLDGHVHCQFRPVTAEPVTAEPVTMEQATVEVTQTEEIST